MSGGASAGSGSTSYSRQGTATQTTQTQLDSAFRSLLNNNVPSNNQDPTAYDYEKKQMTCPTDYESNTQDLYENRMLRALAMSQSGASAVSAPIARGQAQAQSEVMEQFARERGDEVRKQQVIDRQIGTSAAKDFNEQQNSQQSVSTNSLVALASMLYPKVGSNVEDFSGQGDQSSTAYTVSSNPCCFIFLEAYRGELPWWVRDCRDQHAPESASRRRGYVRTAKWLVPAMRVSKLARTLVWYTIVKPLTLAGGWHRKVDGYEKYFYLVPVVKFWFTVWTLLGGKE